jgi:hypothetical protein
MAEQTYSTLVSLYQGGSHQEEPPSSERTGIGELSGHSHQMTAQDGIGKAADFNTWEPEFENLSWDTIEQEFEDLDWKFLGQEYEELDWEECIEKYIV